MFASIAQSATHATSRSLRRTIVLQSHFSSTAGSASESSSCQVYLNPERKRKLISLYHRAEGFITYDNLSKKIDEEFRHGLTSSNERDEDKRATLVNELEERRERSKMFVLSAGDGERSWRASTNSIASKASLRERQVKAALFGLDDPL